jgi:hypothetical protein
MTSLAPTTARGEATITVAGVAYPVRFSLNVLRDYTQATGRKLSEVGTLLAEDIAETIGRLLTHAVRRYVPGQQQLSYEAGFDLMEAMPQAEAEQVADAIFEAVKLKQNPLVGAVIAKSNALSPQPTNGTDTSTSLSVS